VTGPEVFKYVTESPDYRAILGVFAGTFFAELTPDDVTGRLAATGTVLLPETVRQRLDQLVTWGNLDVSASVGQVGTVADYYRRRNRYLITRVGQEVHDVVEGVLAQVDDVRDVSLGRLDALTTALEALLALDVERESPTRLADAVRAVFDPHRAFSAEITQFFAAINQWQSRFDLTEEEFAFFSEVLVGYVGERLDSLERRARPIAALLAEIEPRVPSIVARARSGLAARVADAGLVGVQVRTDHGATDDDWANLARWFRGRPRTPSRIGSLGRDAVDAVRTLTQNLTRLSRSGVGASSRRADYLRLAAMLDAAPPDGPRGAARIAAAAFGLFPCRHLGTVPGDDADPVPTATSWWDAPRAPVPISLRERGETTNRGRSGAVVDRSQQRAHLLERRRVAQQRVAAARAELLGAAGVDGEVDDGVELSEAALRLLQTVLGPAVAALGPHRAKGEAESEGLRCIVERTPGQDLTVRTPAGRLRLGGIAVTVAQAENAT
jgi:uncharacterized protein (TIGR02677 family)